MVIETSNRDRGHDKIKMHVAICSVKMNLYPKPYKFKPCVRHAHQFQINIIPRVG
jgi:hypothetical protein